MRAYVSVPGGVGVRLLLLAQLGRPVLWLRDTASVAGRLGVLVVVHPVDLEQDEVCLHVPHKLFPLPPSAAAEAERRRGGGWKREGTGHAGGERTGQRGGQGREKGRRG